jgi:hypothetical protein
LYHIVLCVVELVSAILLLDFACYICPRKQLSFEFLSMFDGLVHDRAQEFLRVHVLFRKTSIIIFAIALAVLIRYQYNFLRFPFRRCLFSLHAEPWYPVYFSLEADISSQSS